MSQHRDRSRAAIGFTVKSGWASAVLLSGPATAPRVVDSCRIDLIDPEDIANEHIRIHALEGRLFDDARIGHDHGHRVLPGRAAASMVISVFREPPPPGAHGMAPGVE